jgi:tetratricopeptide (TPR) repeat protein
MSTLTTGRNGAQRLINLYRWLLWPILMALLALPNVLNAQGGGGMLFGDLTVDESKVDGSKPLSYDIILYFLDGRVVARQKVANGGRYRFMSLRSGEYDIVVEVENQEVARIRVNVMVLPSGSDIRRDIELEWKANTSRATGSGRKQTISVADFYERSASAKANFEKAQSALDKKNYAEAVALFKAIVEADAKDFQAWTELGTAYLLQKKESEAEKAYLRAVAEKPTFFLALLNLGRVRAAMKDLEGAIEPLTRAVDVQPTNAEANLLLGEAYLQLKKGSKAVTYLNSAASLGRPEAHLLLATLYHAAGLKERAATEYEEFLKKQPNYQDRKKLEKYIADNKKQ